jgi:hypothetical protein
MTAAAADLSVETPNGHPGTPGRIDPDTLNLITTQARQVRPGHALLTFIGSILFFTGWIIAKTAGVIWLAGAWCFTAVRIGWRQARGVPLEQPDIAQVMAENEQLRMAVKRLGG